MENEKAKKFRILAEKRVNEAIKKMRLIGNLANRNNYSYTSEEARQIVSALDSEIKKLKNKFGDGSGGLGSEFRFKSTNE